MPALLSTLTDAKAEPLMAQLAAYWPADSVLARMLVAMSDEALSIMGRRFVAPPTPSLSAQANPGDTTLAVTDATNIGERDVVTFPGGETIEVEGADITSFATTPYAGTLYLATAVTGTYASSTKLTVYHQDQYVVRGRATDPIDETVLLSQQAQLAQAHGPHLQIGGVSRRLFVHETPTWSVHAASYTLPFSGSTGETAADISNWTVQRHGTITLPTGFPNYQNTLWRIQYTGGYRVVPYDVRQAVHNLLANEVAKAMNPIGANEIRADGQQARMTRMSSVVGQPAPMAHHVEEAYRVLHGYRRKGV